MRSTLKSQLYHERVHPIEFQQYPLCPACQKPITFAYDMHEAIITRGDVQRCSFDVYMQIFVKFNTVLTHPESCHITLQHGDDGLRMCMENILEFENKTLVADWLLYMISITKTLGEKIRIINEYLK